MIGCLLLLLLFLFLFEPLLVLLRAFVLHLVLGLVDLLLFVDAAPLPFRDAGDG